MRNFQLARDIRYLQDTGNAGEDIILQEVISYIHHLECKEDRLRKFEDACNEMEAAHFDNKESALKFFEELKN